MKTLIELLGTLFIDESRKSVMHRYLIIYIQKVITNQNIDYICDDSDVSQSFNPNIAPQFITQLEAVSLRAKTALVIGSYEWVLGRFYRIG